MVVVHNNPVLTETYLVALPGVLVLALNRILSVVVVLWYMDSRAVFPAGGLEDNDPVPVRHTYKVSEHVYAEVVCLGREPVGLVVDVDHVHEVVVLVIGVDLAPRRQVPEDNDEVVLLVELQGGGLSLEVVIYVLFDVVVDGDLSFGEDKEGGVHAHDLSPQHPPVLVD